MEVQRWIQAYGRHARVISPKWLRDRILEEAKAVLAETKSDSPFTEEEE